MNPLPSNPVASIQLAPTIKALSNRERLEWIGALLESINEEGQIDEIRKLVNNTRWDDQEPTR